MFDFHWSPSFTNEPTPSYMLEYISYQSLPELKPYQITTFTIKEIVNVIDFSDNFNWDWIFITITKFRVIHKSLPDFFFTLFNFIYKKTAKILDSSSPRIAKNIIFLLSELFSTYREEYSTEFSYIKSYLKTFLPVLLKKTDIINTNNLIKNECIKCIQVIQCNMTYFDTLIILLDIIIKNSKNISLGKITFYLYENIYQVIPFCYFEELTTRQLSSFVEKITTLHNINTTFHKKLSYSILEKFINNHLKFTHFIEDQNLILNIENILKNKEKENESKSNNKMKLIESKGKIQEDKLKYAFYNKY